MNFLKIAMVLSLATATFLVFSRNKKEPISNNCTVCKNGCKIITKAGSFNKADVIKPAAQKYKGCYKACITAKPHTNRAMKNTPVKEKKRYFYGSTSRILLFDWYL